jgi:UDP-N-acetylmuramyl pentapeptide phosphotransferase/UDP-N-acetylglucosamine-1-phosphate transferase
LGKDMASTRIHVGQVLRRSRLNRQKLEFTMLALLVAFGVSVVLTLMLVRFSKNRWRMLADHDLSGPQKLHTIPVPRVGGIGIFLGVVLGLVLVDWRMSPKGLSMGLMLIVCAAPAFLSGLVEDVTKAVSANRRLLATALSACLAFWLLGAQIRDTRVPGLDWVVSFSAGALLVTVVAVAGIANAINIIDGLNGLASMCVVIMLAALAYVAFQVGDPLIATMAMAGIGATLGFFVWNFPAGLIFLGDGGAYFLGFFVAELSILLLVRNPEVSPIFPLLVCIYPAFETLFSIYRRRFLRAVPPNMPDGIHLHSLLYRRVMRWAVGNRSAKALTRRNSMTSPYLWLLCMLSVVPAILFWDNTAMLTAALLLFAVSYVVLYWRIVRFRAPRWLRFSSSRAPPLHGEDNRGI